jgi:hypothetical protein
MQRLFLSVLAAIPAAPVAAIDTLVLADNSQCSRR